MEHIEEVTIQFVECMPHTPRETRKLKPNNKNDKMPRKYTHISVREILIRKIIVVDQINLRKLKTKTKSNRIESNRNETKQIELN